MLNNLEAIKLAKINSPKTSQASTDNQIKQRVGSPRTFFNKFRQN